MKNNKALTLISIILAVIMACFSLACNKPHEDITPDNTSAYSDGTEAPVITASPDGEVTASPTREPEDPAATDEAGSTVEPGGTDQAGNTEQTGTETEPASTGGAQPTDGSHPGDTIAPSVNTPSPSSPVGTALPLPTGGGLVTPTPRPGTTPRPTAAPTATPDPYNSPTCPPINDYEAHYAGATVDCTGLKVGDSFYWTFDLVNEHSRLWSGHWLIDYDERYLRVDAYSTSWSGGITYQITQTWDDENPSSDKPAVVCNPEYMGQTGGKPLGVEDNMYANTGMYLTSFQFYGVQAAGSLIRFKFVVKEIPKNSVMKHDSDGYYLEIPILIYESTATIDNPLASGAYTSVDHGIVTCEPGRLYFAH